MRRLAALVTIFTLLAITCAPAATGVLAMPNVSPPKLKAEYWIKKIPDSARPVLNSSGVEHFNERIIADLPHIVFDLTAYPASLDRKTLSSLLSAVKFPRSTVFIDGISAPDSFQEQCIRGVNLEAVKETNKVRYGISVRRTNIRTFPTLKAVFDSAYDREFDRFQETALDPAEPVLILYESVDKRFYFVQMRNYRGWVDSKDIALAKTRQQWVDYITGSDFLVVTASKMEIGKDPVSGIPLLFQMGAKIPIEKDENKDSGKNYTVIIPVRGSDGFLEFQTQLIPTSADINKGYLPYTRANTLRQAFRMLGDPYGWGGLNNSVDCSSFIANIFRTMGIELPRNADEQESVQGYNLSFAGKSVAERSTLIKQLPPGSPVFMNGHVMLYLGQSGGKPYIIHSLGSHSTKDPSTGRLQRVSVMRVVVSDLDLLIGSNRTFLEALNGGIDYR